jgi:hypothetical protein
MRADDPKILTAIETLTRRVDFLEAELYELELKVELSCSKTEVDSRLRELVEEEGSPISELQRKTEELERLINKQ